MKQNTMIVIGLIAVLAFAIYGGYISISTPAGSIGDIGDDNDVAPTQIPGGGINGIFSGNLAIASTWIDHGNLDAAITNNATIKVLHADGSLFGTTSVGATITGQVYPSDNGKLSIIMTPVSTAYIDASWTTLQNQGEGAKLSVASPTVVSGVTVYKYTLDVSKAAPLGGGETSRTVTLIVGEYVADVSGLAYNSVVNGTASTFSGTTYVASSATGYISGMSQTDAFKITKVELSMPDTANATMYDDGKIKQLQIVIGMGNGQSPLYVSSFAHSTGSLYITGNIGVADSTQEYYGLPVVYGLQDAATAISYTVNAQCANFVASSAWVPTLTIGYVGPDGTPGTISRPIAFTDS